MNTNWQKILSRAGSWLLLYLSLVLGYWQFNGGCRFFHFYGNDRIVPGIDVYKRQTDDSIDTYGLIVYLHAGGFTSGDKSDDAKMLQWLCSLGYVTAGINYNLAFSEENPNANIYTQDVYKRQG